MSSYFLKIVFRDHRPSSKNDSIPALHHDSTGSRSSRRRASPAVAASWGCVWLKASICRRWSAVRNIIIARSPSSMPEISRTWSHEDPSPNGKPSQPPRTGAAGFRSLRPATAPSPLKIFQHLKKGFGQVGIFPYKSGQLHVALFIPVRDKGSDQGSQELGLSLRKYVFADSLGNEQGLIEPEF